MFMQSRGDSSILRSLAVAFGDGLAFGVGVKLSQNAARQIGATQRATVKRIEPTPPAPGPPEHKSGLDQKALEAVRKYRFKPAMKDGKTPVPVMITVEVNFRLY